MILFDVKPYERAVAASVERTTIIAILFDAEPYEHAVLLAAPQSWLMLSRAIQTCCC